MAESVMAVMGAPVDTGMMTGRGMGVIGACADGKCDFAEEDG